MSFRYRHLEAEAEHEVLGTHTEGHSVQMGQHVRASSTNVSASSRETAAVLKPTAKGSAIANSTNSQLLSCAQT